MGANAGVADYLEPASPQRGMDLSLYIEAELERQQLQQKIDEARNEIENLKKYIAEEMVICE